MQKSQILHQPETGRKPRASAMQKTDASGTAVQSSVSWGVASKTERPPSSLKSDVLAVTELRLNSDAESGPSFEEAI